MKRVGPIATVTGLLLAGCSSLSGLSGSSSYACKAPEGVACDSVSGTYANALQNNLPSQRKRPTSTPPASGPLSASADPSGRAAATTVAAAPVVGLPPTPVALRSSPRILRLWFKPWEDADHDLYDQGYVYVQVDAGQWQIEHVQRQIRDAYVPVKAPPRASAAGEATPASDVSKSLARPGAATPMPALPRLTPTPPQGADGNE